MPILHIPLDPQKGPLIPIRVDGMEVQALIDTGAEFSSVDERLVYELGLKDAGKITVFTATSEGSEVGAYEATFAIQGPPGTYDFVVSGLRVAAGKLAAQGFLAILGRDVLGHCSVTYDGPTQSCTIAY